MITIDYNKAKSKAIQLKLIAFGKTQAIRAYYLSILNRIEDEELTQIVAISFFRAHSENISFYKAFCNEIASMGMYKDRNKDAFIDAPLAVENATEIRIDDKSIQYRQARNLYLGLGLKRFHKYVCPEQNFSSLRRWTYEAFREEGNRGGRNKTQSIIDRVMEKEKGMIRLSKSSSSIYLKSNETVIRISDHEPTNNNYDFNIQINKY